jgi:hypothetical protein
VATNHLDLYSPLAPSACASRIRAEIDVEKFVSLSALFGSKPVVGRVTDSTLRLRKRIWYRNSFQTYLTATMRPEGSGTRICGEFAMHGFARAFMAVWFGLVLLIGGGSFIFALISGLRDTSQLQSALSVFLFGAPMLVFGTLLVWFGRYLARDEARFMTEFLRNLVAPNP